MIYCIEYKLIYDCLQDKIKNKICFFLILISKMKKQLQVIYYFFVQPCIQILFFLNFNMNVKTSIQFCKLHSKVFKINVFVINPT